MSIKGFVPIKISLPEAANLPVSTHNIYVKPHLSKLANEQQDTTKSLFIINILPNFNITNVKSLFNQISKPSLIEKVTTREIYDSSRISENSGINYDIHINLSMLTNSEFGFELEEFEKLPFGCSVVTFIDRDGFELFLKEIKKDKYKAIWNSESSNSNSNSTSISSANFKTKFSTIQYLNRSELENKVANKLIEFQQREKQVEDEVQNMRNLVDDDGFTLVVGSQRKTKNSILGSIKKKQELLDENNEILKKEKKKEKQDFYRFQIRERKKQEMNQLLSKFKQDQKRVQQMREKRRFKPY